MFSKSSLATAAVALSLASGTDAFWRQICGTVNTGRIDPIMAPGAISSHVHKLAGGSNINTTATYESMRQSSCTSCEVGADKSGYWHPQLYYQHGDGTFEEVPNTGMTVYYLGRGDVANAKPFPPGFQMLSGNMFARSYDNTTMTWGNKTYPPRPVADRVSFVCLNDGNTVPDANHMAVTDCPYGLRAQIQMQSCWDGVNNYLPYSAHVDYLSQIDNGACSPKFPVQLPHLFFEVLYSVASISKTDGGKFTFSYGDSTGYGFHGDFLNGWDPTVLKDSIDQCLSIGKDASGTIDACPPLVAVENYGMTSLCSQTANGGRIAPIINETVLGKIGTSLPGCGNIVYGGPANPPVGYNDCPASTPNPAYNKAAVQTPWVFYNPTPGTPAGLSGWNYTNCYVDGTSGGRTLSSATLAAPNMTVEVCQAFCAGKGYVYAGTEYADECYCGNSILPAALSTGAQTGCTMQCAGNVTEYCGGPNMISIYKNVNIALKASSPAVAATAAISSAASSSIAVSAKSSSAAGAVSTSSAASAGSSSAAIAASTSTAAGAGPTSTAAGIYVGCAVDNQGGRALNGSSTTSSSMTLEFCRSYCDNLGYMYSGTEYGRECYCGNYYTASTGVFSGTNTLLASNSTCNMLCAGNKNETCGGSNRMSIFNSTNYQPILHVATVSTYKWQGCYSEPSGGRALQSYSFTNTTAMTAELCVNSCAAKGFSYAGMEYAQECYCGNAIIGGASASTADCSMPCVGNKYEFCGAGNRLDVYFNAASSAAVSSSSSSKASSTPITSSAASVAPVMRLASSVASSSSAKTTSVASSSSAKLTSTTKTSTSTKTSATVSTASHAKRHILSAKGAKGRKHGRL